MLMTTRYRLAIAALLLLLSYCTKMLVQTLFPSLALTLLGGTVPGHINIKEFATLPHSQSIITNNVPWVDTDGNKIKANRKPNISEKIGDYWYLVGSESTPECEPSDAGGGIFIYRSANLATGSWEFVKNIPDLDVRSCVMNVYSGGTVYLHCRMRVCISTKGPEGEYDCNHFLNMPDSSRKVGGSSTFRDDDDEHSLYFVTSRKKKGGHGTDRSVFIYKFHEEDWTKLYKEPVANWVYVQRESPYIVKNNDKYYLFTSRTDGWKNSTTYYLVSESLDGFSSNLTEQAVVMHPSDTILIQSMGTQFGFIQKIDNTWFFGGRRYPVEDPCRYGQEYGTLLMTSFQFDYEGVPHVYWKESFDWQSKDYNVTAFEEHTVESYISTCQSFDAGGCDGNGIAAGSYKTLQNCKTSAECGLDCSDDCSKKKNHERFLKLRS